MKRKNKKQNKILPVILTMLGLVVVAAITFLAFKFLKPKKDDTPVNNIGDMKTVDDTPQEDPEPQIINDHKNNFQEKIPIIQYDGDDPNNNNSISGAITYTGISDDTLVIRVNIDQYINTGNCYLTLTGNNTNYIEVARVIDSASTSTCEGFNIPLSVINDHSFRITIEINGDDKQGVIQKDMQL